MKKIRAFIICIILIVHVSVLGKNTTESEITGRVIYYTESMIEVKKGNEEYSFYWDRESVVLRAGETGAKEDIELCQIVKVIYSNENGKKLINKIYIIKESDCLDK